MHFDLSCKMQPWWGILGLQPHQGSGIVVAIKSLKSNDFAGDFEPMGFNNTFHFGGVSISSLITLCLLVINAALTYVLWFILRSTTWQVGRTATKSTDVTPSPRFARIKSLQKVCRESQKIVTLLVGKRAAAAVAEVAGHPGLPIVWEGG